jgi:hypothetical protein
MWCHGTERAHERVNVDALLFSHVVDMWILEAEVVVPKCMPAYMYACLGMTSETGEMMCCDEKPFLIPMADCIVTKCWGKEMPAIWQTGTT